MVDQLSTELTKSDIKIFKIRMVFSLRVSILHTHTLLILTTNNQFLINKIVYIILKICYLENKKLQLVHQLTI